jgi:L-2-hydroxycarboxylate dehydrogenase (NAD+)
VEAFEATQVPPADVHIVASTLVEAELRGLSSHGIMRLEAYLTKLVQGGFNPRPNIQVVAVRRGNHLALF